MQRSSESVAALASALAKAQAELVNPEKSLTATITTGRSGERERTFRYAPLSSGLDIVRKILGQHEIATMQTTAIDQASGLVNLTTVLAHASGEWIASDWPVCPIAEMATPHRMGAALTYARRYALFTLVGIAGEDDLDAPDLTACGPAAGGAFDPRQGRFPSGQSGNGRVRGAAKSNAAVVLDADKSAALREKLLAEIASLTSAEFAVTWATQALPAKNSLVAADAKILEDAFEQKLSAISSTPMNETFTGESAAAIEMRPQEEPPAPGAASNQPAGIDKSGLMIAAPRRYRNREHLRYVTLQPCLLCGRKPSDAHHLRFVQPRALGRKASDEFAVPLCRIHHRTAHRASNERAWWKAAGIDPLKVARKLWKDTRASNGQNRPKLSLQAARTDPPFTSDAIGNKAP
jgi:ERF superfamily